MPAAKVSWVGIDASMPFGRVCQPEDVAASVRFLVSDQAAYLTGQKITVDGDAHRGGGF